MAAGLVRDVLRSRDELLAENWASAGILLKPETILRWHREGFRLFWKRRSKPAKQRDSRIDSDTVELVRRMTRENRLWGAERIRGELLKLGIRVSKRTRSAWCTLP
jgi:hypothetical protein